MSQGPERSPTDYDVVVIGGAFCGSAAAILLRRALPEARVLVAEFRPEFPHKVGEATVEVSALFLHRVLGQYDHLSKHHLPKHGLRYWFSDGGDRGLGEMSEVGPYEAPRLPSFQLDRSQLDEHLLAVARTEGAEVLRPARVLEVEEHWPQSKVRLQVTGDDGAFERTVTTRWVLDASGRHAFLGRRKKLLERRTEHPIAAAWGRYRGVVDLDGAEFQPSLTGRPPIPEIPASRRLATNHFCGRGWWTWVIPLANGKTSIGVVYHKELYDLPGDGDRKDRLDAHIRSTPGLRDLVRDAELDRDDALSYSHIPYLTRQYMDRGWALLGDAAAFMDPYYSPGLDHCSISTFATVDIVRRDLAGESNERQLLKEIVEHNEAFERSYNRWLDALYIGKYDILGDAELTACAFLVDTSLYYMGVVTPAYRKLESLKNPPFGIALVQAKTAYKLARAFNRRLQKLAHKRLARGTYGDRNLGWRLFSPSFGLGRAAFPPLWRGLALWLRIELGELFGRRRKSASVPVEVAPARER